MLELTALPLSGVRIVDLGDPVAEDGARLLADLGADVVKVRLAADESPRGSETSLTEIRRAVANANKRLGQVDLDSATDRARLTDLITSADALVVAADVATGLDLVRLREANPALVVTLSSPFGSTGPRSTWQATERTLLALSGSMSRSGRPGDPPLVPPDGIAAATAATHLAWCTLIALQEAARTGTGQQLDMSHHESVTVGLDPAFGVQGSAAAGRSGSFRRGRPPADSYPVFECADGQVRLCLLAKRQWRGMFGWLGAPEEFADPAYDSISARVAAWPRLSKLIADLFADESAEALVEEAARRGVPLARVMTVRDALEADHFTKAGTIARVPLLPGTDARLPVGSIDLDGDRIGFRAPMPSVAEDPLAPWAARTPAAVPRAADEPPFAGLRVLDLGVIVFGAEIGRAFADLGADVIKIESLTFPDGLRQTRGGEAMNASFAWGHRNRRSFGLDLRTTRGREVFLELAATADVVLSNFKPGTLASLGISYDDLTALRPDLIVVESAAFSSKGPWAARLGYGPLVRAACGISSLWRYGPDETECWDGVTVYPDHVAGRVGALAVVAALWRRRCSGRGAHIEFGQSDVVLTQLAGYVASEDLEPGSVTAVGNRGRELFGGVFPCAGDDEWCVIDARVTEELDTLAAIVGARSPATLGSEVAAWTSQRSPVAVMEALQAVGVPAAAMVRLPELLDDPQLQHRGTFTTMNHPLLDQPLPAEDVTAPYESVVVRPATPAPSPGQHTRDISTGALGLTESEIEDLLAAGAIHDGAPR
ncbi:CaiB/BaiF CoA-transferase family protein [Nocardioides ultimimeridianus]